MFYCFECESEFCEPKVERGNPSGLAGGLQYWEVCPHCGSEWFEYRGLPEIREFFLGGELCFETAGFK